MYGRHMPKNADGAANGDRPPGRFGRHAAAIVLAGLWISLNEFLRNQLVLAAAWQHHYHGLGLTFPAAPLNGAVWGVWSLGLAALITGLAPRFSWRATAALGWFGGFGLMWLVIGNMGVLPLAILPVAVPWSAAECAGAAWIARRILRARAATH